MRTGTIDITPEQSEALVANINKAIIAALDAAVKDQNRRLASRLMEIGAASELCAAIGYLSSWGMASPSYAHVTIRCADDGSKGEPELVACYYPDKDLAGHTRPTYVIGAIWHNDHWGYHS